MSDSKPEQSAARKKLSTAMAMLLFTSHRLPGVRGYELRRKLGKNYLKVVESLNHRLEHLGLRVKILFETSFDREPSEEDYDRARFFITLADPISLSDVVAAGWRVDELAVLSGALAILFSRGGKAPKKEISELLESKLPKWRVDAALEKFVRRGYLVDSGDGTLSVGWRAVAEVDQKQLLKSLTEMQEGREPATQQT
ncbi:MAG: hypothetical protein RMI43_02985 [Candidatus Caldarchaeum sp.]|nr:hypothetical protein [Candidatus Caldarchaeum sp.]MCX8201551.1 hypothetical protein [Candidatus Caldarchaeum sp.]MDW8063116.1 hypothetical protein [Candidatus Caldarchaeum sp.]MDW8435613.1 hypothetical protein [Candidatus Caldarchaeum sp.]